jgi:hypothetical protein
MVSMLVLIVVDHSFADLFRLKIILVYRPSTTNVIDATAFNIFSKDMHSTWWDDVRFVLYPGLYQQLRWILPINIEFMGNDGT